MSVIRTIPKSALFREVAAKFSYDFQFGGPYAGQYVCANNKINMLSMNMNTFYLVDNISVCSQLPEFHFVESLQTDFINIRLRHYLRDELISAQPIYISQYYREKSISSHVICNRHDDGILMEINGRLNQIAYTVGLNTILFSVSMGTYEIDGQRHNEFIRDLDR